MKKKVLSLVLTAAMMTTMLAGCGSMPENKYYARILEM